jgi:hypothetical protein
MSTVFRHYSLGFTQIHLDLFPGGRTSGRSCEGATPEAEPLYQRACGIVHPQLTTMINNYARLLLESGTSKSEEIDARIAQIGQEAGFDAESFRELLAFLGVPF